MGRKSSDVSPSGHDVNGMVAERLIALVLKTDVSFGTLSSNLSHSSIEWWLSGLKRLPAKELYRKVPRVQISPILPVFASERRF